MNLTTFRTLLTTFLEADYSFVTFPELNGPERRIALRHDIDFDVTAALKTAEVEHELGIRATYFFLVSSDGYNLFTGENTAMVRRIAALGHTVSVHFDPTVYEDFPEGLALERKLFDAVFGTTVEIVSLHRPNDFFQQHDKEIDGCEHTYMSKYFRDVDYISDSTGAFRYGHPLESEAYRLGKPIHLLLHPIWWVYGGTDNLATLRTVYELKKTELRQHYAANCLPFQSIIDDLT